MDLGTLHLILNAHHLVGGTVDLDTIIRKVMKESTPPVRQSKLSTDSDTTTHVYSKSRDSVRGANNIIDYKSNTSMNREPHIYIDTKSHAFSKHESHVISANTLHVVSNRDVLADSNTKSCDFTNNGPNVVSDTSSYGISESKSNVFTNRESDVLFYDTTLLDISYTTSRPFNNISAHHSQSPQLTYDNPTYPVHNTGQIGYDTTYRMAVSSDISKKERAHSYRFQTQDGELPSMCCKRTQNSDTDDGEVTVPKLRNISSRGKEASCQLQSIDTISSVLSTQQDEYYDVSAVERIIQTLVKAQKVFEMPIEDKATSFSKKQEHGSKSNYKQLQDSHPDNNTSPRPDVRENEDVSGIMDKLMMLIQQRIIQTVKFAKLIPGFTDLNVDDMLALLKASKSESQMIESNVFDWKTNEINTSFKDKLNMKTLINYLPKEYMERRILVGMKLSELHLTERETAVLRAVVITFTDRVDLRDRESATKVYNQMCSCLRHVVGYGQSKNSSTTRLNEIDKVLRFVKESTESYTPLLGDALKKSNILNHYEVIKEYLNL